MQRHEEVSLATIVATLSHLHRVKDGIYRDAWRRRGELIGIFANIARKYDRLEIAASEADADSIESRADTAADLAIYAAKYLTWLIEHDPSLADAFDADPTAWSGVQGHAALHAVLENLDAAEGQRQIEPRQDLGAAFVRISKPFRQLEDSLVSGAPLDSNLKAELVWRLSDGATRYLWRLAHDRPDTWAIFARQVSALG